MQIFDKIDAVGLHRRKIEQKERLNLLARGVTTVIDHDVERPEFLLN